MGEPGLLYGEREWFYDVRTPVRRMAVALHPDQGIVVVSLWQGEVCTATFRLPLADAGRLVGLLANGMARELGGPRLGGPTPPVRPHTGWQGLRSWFRHGRTGPPPALRLLR